MQLQLNPKSFIKTGVNKYGYDVGTIEVNGQRQIGVLRFDSAGTMHVALYGYVGRYRTATKWWQASVEWTSTRGFYVDFGRDDRCGRFNKQNSISYLPEVFAELCNPHYWTAI